MSDKRELQGLVPGRLKPRLARVILDSLAIDADIGFHDYEIGNKQRLLVTVEVWLDHVPPAGSDEPEDAWDYDMLREQVEALVAERRYNLQETLAHAIYGRVASMRGVHALRVTTAKPDTYRDARSVAVELSSFSGRFPEG